MKISTRRTALSLCLGVLGLVLGMPPHAVMAQQPTSPTTTQKPLQPRPEVQALLDQARQAKSRYQWQEAMLLYRQAGQEALALKDQAGEAITLMGVAATLNDLGGVCARNGQPQEALQYYRKALPLLVDDKVGEANTLNNIGFVYARTGQPQEALKYLQKALPLEAAADDKADRAATLSNIGGVYVSIGQPQEALKYLQQALPLEAAADDKVGQARTLNNIGSVYASTGQPQKALDYFRQALPLEVAAADTAGQATTLNGIGSMYADTGQPQEALDYLQRALFIEESFYHQISDPAQIAAFQKQEVGNLYVETALVFQRLHRPGDALAMLERGRNNGLARLAGQNRLPLTALLGKDAPTWQQVNDHLTALDQSVRTTRQRLSNAQAGAETVEEKAVSQQLAQQLAAIQQQQQQAEAERDGMLTHLERDHPDFQRLFLSQKTVYPALKAALLTPQNADTLFLEYAVEDDKTTLLFVLSRKDGLHPFVLPIGRKALADKIDKWRDSIEHQLPDEPGQARELFQALLPHAQMKALLGPGRYRSLVIVSDGPLLDAPLAALLDNSGKRLIQRYALSAPFSLAMLTWPTSQRIATRNLLAVANPLGPRPELPETERQARAMLPLFRPADLLTAAGATREAVLRQIGQCRLLHFGVHGGGERAERPLLAPVPGGEDSGRTGVDGGGGD